MSRVVDRDEVVELSRIRGGTEKADRVELVSGLPNRARNGSCERLPREGSALVCKAHTAKQKKRQKTSTKREKIKEAANILSLTKMNSLD